jgi:hypothetical protein
MWFGAIDEFGLSEKPLKRASNSSVEIANKLLEKGAEIVRDWPTAFLAKLDLWRCKPDKGTGLQLFRSAFPGLLRRVARLESQLWRDRILAALDNYAVHSRLTAMPIIGRQTFLTRTDSQKAVASELGIRTERLQSILDQSRTAAFVRSTANGRSRRYIDSAAVAQASAFLASQMSTKQAASYLGLSPPRIEQLIVGKTLLRRDGWLSRSELDAFCTKLLAAARELDTPVSKPVSLSYVLQNWVPVTMTSELFQAIGEGSISFRKGETSSVSSWIVEESSIRAWRASLPYLTSEYFSIPESAARLGLKQQVVYGLVNSKLLKTSVQFLRKRRARCITRVEIVNFQKAYVALSSLARRHKIQNKQSVSWAVAQGMKLVTGPSIDGSRQYFVRTESIPRILYMSTNNENHDHADHL